MDVKSFVTLTPAVNVKNHILFVKISLSTYS
jgi:hypothetical protein